MGVQHSCPDLLLIIASGQRVVGIVASPVVVIMKLYMV